jgi:DNA gyrase subunit A
MTEKGYGKRSPLDQFMAKSRGSKGVSSIDKHSRNKIGYLAAARIVEEEDEITLISSNGVLIRLDVAGISSMGRTTRGVRVMDINEGDSLATMARINASILKGKEMEQSETMTTQLEENGEVAQIETQVLEISELSNEPAPEENSDEE